ncbi:chaperone/heat shock protein Hsp12 [Penicillium macrosclerotiorum]|uniref:chaperone/heat shock protein Hsp12 n=1 Tax=Penicillium macrosclerotiorum TaxID=303699 RepID=UPI0025482A1E|nr:chaperone/heat shock protein Hsp12 [Penicillium macrosclerotiorum]KAJ5679704.1 chaperone/heat shock protein Hsp12 [Penicillium macrosclerotiorum]
MSDTGRKDFSTKAKEEITPDSSKSTQDKIKETVTDTTDRVARGFQSDDSKGGAQEAFDKTQRTHDNEAHGGASNSIGDKVKNALGMNN